MPPRIVWFAVLSVVATLLAFTVDQQLAQAMTAVGPRGLHIARIVTWFGQGGAVLYPVGILAILGFLFKFVRPGLADRLDPAVRALVVIFVAVAAAGISDDILKVLLGRARPPLWLAGDDSGFQFFRFGWKYNSFPSGHTTTSFAAAVVFGALFPRGRVVFALLAALIGLSRIVLDVHYLSDVLAGATLGGFVALAILIPFRRLGWAPCPDRRNPAGRPVESA